ncbi:1-acyl-sn-glycerol-3-phosphate acyltransferase [Flammeovirga kamogawensis]|uniref:1-acyl-sn-glycerol-3-phosphate acyltransferase n=1 Tax=Flammeovirga kamogawensis TaxID=373891 RepID=A0ABX8H0L0_9BACT|nr:1-acyl-sn-glycerol-3-phosphate acyltransferase [Flammeovirga kamogawensis]MBB6459138.1 1-acyl-sn-glycerol-3-phosphate acyltransferase [Flammeovirga kamogawensis]QWG08705.1 1-acyl-sn-glycerol-3-phosphate acyltransferase [Flammeovirga kamogawensis]TRX66999.1 acyltransferase [Flammeovirga kamogawensis]
MIRLIFRFLFNFNGWSLKVDHVPVDKLERSVFLAAPHTTNWDAVYMVAAMRKINVKLRFAIKKEWIRFPLSIAIKPMGAIGIDRRPINKREKKISMVDAISNLFKENDKLALVMPPEGSRSLRKEWKSGFYYVAVQSKVPIALAYLDYKKKTAGVYEVFEPTGNFEEDMKYITSVYKTNNPTAKFPELYSLDERFV